VVGHNALTLFFGGNIPTRGAWDHGGGFITMLGYAAGSRAASVQVRVGYGYDTLIGETGTPHAASILADVAAGIGLGRHVQLLLQADGRKLLGQQGGALRLWPGLRFFPLEAPQLSLGAGAQWWLDSFPTATTSAGF